MIKVRCVPAAVHLQVLSAGDGFSESVAVLDRRNGVSIPVDDEGRAPDGGGVAQAS